MLREEYALCAREKGLLTQLCFGSRMCKGTFFPGLVWLYVVTETGNCKEKFIDKQDPKTYD